MRQLNAFFATAREREAIRRRRLAGAPWPWTQDKVFRDWRFCNVHREHDRTTEWFRDNVRSKLTGLAAVEACVVFRWFNRIETGERIKDLLLTQWDGAEARRRLKDVRPTVTGAYTVNYKNNYAVFSGAYMIKSPNGKTKTEGILWCIEQARAKLPMFVERWGASLRSACEDLQQLPFMGSFMAYEVISDVRWTDVLHLASDINTWAAAGPGCARGLGRVVTGSPTEYNYHSSRDQEVMLAVMRDVLAASRDTAYWPYTDTPWEMREVEHWSCEFDKYQRGVHGERLKRRYQYAGD
jgi:hypothetical protein